MRRATACGWTGLMTVMAVVLLMTACGARDDTGADAPAEGARPPQSNDAPPQTAAVDSRPVVLVVGTSLTAGLGLGDPEDAFPGVLQRKADSTGLGVRFVNAGLSGETSAGALRRLDWLLTEIPAVVIVETGANDGLRGLDPDSTEANLRSIVARIRERAPSAAVAIVQMEAPPNLGAGYTARFRGAYVRVAQETGATRLPFLLEGVAGEPTMNQADGIHPTAAGAARAADNIWGGVAALIRTRLGASGG